MYARTPLPYHLNPPPRVRLPLSCFCCSAPPASEEQEVASELEESFSWKDVLKHVLRLRNDNKLSEGIVMIEVNAGHSC